MMIVIDNWRRNYTLFAEPFYDMTASNQVSKFQFYKNIIAIFLQWI